MTYTIYKIENTVNDKIYIGYTKRDLRSRFAEHVRSANRINCKTKIGRAIRKHGAEHFTISSIVTTDDRTICNKLEDDYILEFDSISSGYNIARGGQGGMIALFPENPEYENIKGKIAASNKAKAHLFSDLSKQNHKAKTIGMYNRAHSEKSRKKISESNIGKKNSPEHIRKFVESCAATRSAPDYIDPRKGKKRNLKRVVCEYCSRDINISDYKRNHIDNHCASRKS